MFNFRSCPTFFDGSLTFVKYLHLGHFLRYYKGYSHAKLGNVYTLKSKGQQYVQFES